MITYEDRLNSNIKWAILEGSMHFENRSAVHKSIRRIAVHLDELNLPYAVLGAMALFFHGFRRFTESIELLVTRDGLEEIHRQLERRGYIPHLTNNKKWRTRNRAFSSSSS